MIFSHSRIHYSAFKKNTRSQLCIDIGKITVKYIIGLKHKLQNRIYSMILFAQIKDICKYAYISTDNI